MRICNLCKDQNFRWSDPLIGSFRFARRMACVMVKTSNIAFSPQLLSGPLHEWNWYSNYPRIIHRANRKLATIRSGAPIFQRRLWYQVHVWEFKSGSPNLKWCSMWFHRLPYLNPHTIMWYQSSVKYGPPIWFVL